jgi:hypothetical protein
MVLNINNKILLDIGMSYDNNLEPVPPLLDNDSIESNLLHELQLKQQLWLHLLDNQHYHG